MQTVYYSNFKDEGNNLKKWLSSLIKERLGEDIHLNLGINAATLSHKLYENIITISEHNDSFYRIGGIIKHETWIPREYGLECLGSNFCPCPGKLFSNMKMVESIGGNIKINYDILGLFFWKLSLIEEVTKDSLDVHKRFCGKNSHAYKNNYLNVPIVDVWFSLLQQICKKIWPAYGAPQKSFKVTPTHDVDRPSKFQFQNKFSSLRIMLSDKYINNKFQRMLSTFLDFDRKNQFIKEDDPYNTFSWIMEESERRNLTSEFYFLSGTNCKNMDADFKLEYPAIKQLMKQIKLRGHKIGVHPSYLCLDDEVMLRHELINFSGVLKKAGVNSSAIHSRMHYLRWSHPKTLRSLERLNVSSDSTLGYHDYAGFRCGTSHDYSAIDPVTKKDTKIRIRPLIAMESTLLPLDKNDITRFELLLKQFVSLKNQCKLFNGNFLFLWHNSELYNDPLRYTYQSLLDA